MTVSAHGSRLNATASAAAPPDTPPSNGETPSASQQNATPKSGPSQSATLGAYVGQVSNESVEPFARNDSTKFRVVTVSSAINDPNFKSTESSRIGTVPMEHAREDSGTFEKEEEILHKHDVTLTNPISQHNVSSSQHEESMTQSMSQHDDNISQHDENSAEIDQLEKRLSDELDPRNIGRVWEKVRAQAEVRTDVRRKAGITVPALRVKSRKQDTPKQRPKVVQKTPTEQRKIGKSRKRDAPKQNQKILQKTPAEQTTKKRATGTLWNPRPTKRQNRMATLPCLDSAAALGCETSNIQVESADDGSSSGLVPALIEPNSFYTQTQTVGARDVTAKHGQPSDELSTVEGQSNGFMPALNELSRISPAADYANARPSTHLLSNASLLSSANDATINVFAEAGQLTSSTSSLVDECPNEENVLQPSNVAEKVVFDASTRTEVIDETNATVDPVGQSHDAMSCSESEPMSSSVIAHVAFAATIRTGAVDETNAIVDPVGQIEKYQQYLNELESFVKDPQSEKNAIIGVIETIRHGLDLLKGDVSTLMKRLQELELRLNSSNEKHEAEINNIRERISRLERSDSGHRRSATQQRRQHPEPSRSTNNLNQQSNFINRVRDGHQTDRHHSQQSWATVAAGPRANRLRQREPPIQTANRFAVLNEEFEESFDVVGMIAPITASQKEHERREMESRKNNLRLRKLEMRVADITTESIARFMNNAARDVGRDINVTSEAIRILETTRKGRYCEATIRFESLNERKEVVNILCRRRNVLRDGNNRNVTHNQNSEVVAEFDKTPRQARRQFAISLRKEAAIQNGDQWTINRGTLFVNRRRISLEELAETYQQHCNDRRPTERRPRYPQPRRIAQRPSATSREVPLESLIRDQPRSSERNQSSTPRLVDPPMPIPILLEPTPTDAEQERDDVDMNDALPLLRGIAAEVAPAAAQ